MNKKRLVSVFGISGVVLYVLTALLGQLIVPGYNPTLRTISMLVYVGAPHKLLFDVLFIASNILLLFFAIGISSLLNRSLVAKIGAFLLSIAAILQIILFLFFPVQSIYDKMSSLDRIHQEIVNVTVVLLIISIIALGYGIFELVNARQYLVYSFTTAISLFVVGLITSHEISSRSEIRGLWERIMIGLFLQWIIATSIKIYHLKRIPG
jgi:hypothetical protein